MNHKLKRKWCAALRGNPERQCFGAYHKDGKHCALGELENVLRASGAENLILRSHITIEAFDHVLVMNDCYHKSFPEIADWIETNL
jgi:hypothetical protein